MTYQYDFAAMIGRFNPIHCGHTTAIQNALTFTDKLVLILGSHDKALNTRDPFTTEQRIDLIRMSFSSAENERITIVPQFDYTYNDDRWIASVQTAVHSAAWAKWRAGPTKIALTGYDKDSSTYYLKKFPQYDFVPLESRWPKVSATDVRTFYLAGLNNWRNFIDSKEVIQWMEDFKSTDQYKRLATEFRHIEDYKMSYDELKYKPTFNTVDSVVTQSGHVLLVERGDWPGKGLWALPGGYLEQSETLEEGALRELKEETRIDVPLPVLKGSLVRSHTFDDPFRSQLGRTITQAYYFKLNENYSLPKVKGSDDAKKAFWVPFEEVVKNRGKFFDDHYHVISYFVGI